MTKNEKAAMLAELKGLYEQYHRISPKDCEQQRTMWENKRRAICTACWF